MTGGPGTSGLRAVVVGVSMLMAAGQAVGASPARRIVTLAPHLAELTHAAGAGDRLVGTVAFSDHPAAVRTVPRVGDAFLVDIERLIALRPDLVLAWESGTPVAQIERLAGLGLNVVAVPARRIGDVGIALRMIGRLAGTTATADVAALAFDAEVAQLRKRHAGAAPLSVFIQIDDRPLYTVNGRQLISEVVSLCGGRNVFSGLDALAPAIGIEAVIGADPEVILSTDDSGDAAVAMWRAWPQLRATRSGNLYTLVADDITRPTPRLVNGIRQVCAVLDRARATTGVR